MTSLNPSRTTLKPFPFSQAPLAFHATFHGRPARVIPVVCLSPPGVHLHAPSPCVGPGARLVNKQVTFLVSGTLLGPLPLRALPVPALPVAQQNLSQLEVHFDLQDFCSQASFMFLGKRTVSTPSSSPSTIHPFICSLRSLFSTPPPPPVLPLSPSLAHTLRCCPLRTRAEGSGASVGRPAAIHPRTELPSAKLMVLTSPPPVSILSQGPCCGPVLLFTQPPPDPLNCR